MWDSLARQIEMEIVSFNITQGEKLEEEQEPNTEKNTSFLMDWE